jgi:hypothetical protein
MKIHPFTKSGLAGLAGLATVALLILALYFPVEEWGTQYFHLFDDNEYPPSHKHRFMMILMGWFALPAIAGGYACAWLAPRAKLTHVFITALAGILILAVVIFINDGIPSQRDIREVAPAFISLALFFTAGGFACPPQKTAWKQHRAA